MRYKTTVWHGEGDSLFYVVDTEAPPDEQPCVVGTFSGGNMERQLALLSAHALNKGASLFFIGIEQRGKTMLFHIKHRDRPVTQSITTRALGWRLLMPLTDRHPQAIVDFWTITSVKTFHRLYRAGTLDEIKIQGED